MFAFAFFVFQMGIHGFSLFLHVFILYIFLCHHSEWKDINFSGPENMEHIGSQGAEKPSHVDHLLNAFR